jgi:hypothetical protein
MQLVDKLFSLFLTNFSIIITISRANYILHYFNKTVTAFARYGVFDVCHLLLNWGRLYRCATSIYGEWQRHAKALSRLTLILTNLSLFGNIVFMYIVVISVI